MSKEENQCSIKKELELLKVNLKIESEKQAKITEISWPYKEKAN